MNMYFEFQTPPRLLSGAFALENIADVAGAQNAISRMEK